MLVSITRKVNNLNQDKVNKPKKRKFFRIIAFTDPNTGLQFNRFDNYQENKQDYHDTFRLVVM